MRRWPRGVGAAVAVVIAAVVPAVAVPAALAVAAMKPGAGAVPARGARAPTLMRAEVGFCILESPPAQRAHLEALARRAALILPEIEAEIGARPAGSYRIVLIPAGPLRDPDLAALDAEAPPWAAGFLLPSRRLGSIRIALADRYPHADLASVLAHEATHMLLHDAAGGNLPRWFGEGVATGLERSWGLRDVLVYSSSLLTGRLPALADLDAAFEASGDTARAAYAASFDFLLWTVRRHGKGIVRDIVRQAAARPFPEAWEAATGESLARSEAEWRRGSLLLYRWVPALTGTTTLWIGITLLALVAGARRRARTREILASWDVERDGEESAGTSVPGRPGQSRRPS